MKNLTRKEEELEARLYRMQNLVSSLQAEIAYLVMRFEEKTVRKSLTPAAVRKAGNGAVQHNGGMQ